MSPVDPHTVTTPVAPRLRGRFYLACAAAPLVVLLGIAASFATGHGAGLAAEVAMGWGGLVAWVLSAHIRAYSRAAGGLPWLRCMVVAVGLLTGMSVTSLVAAGVAAAVLLPPRHSTR